ncbi:hypothetical protein, partial [Klebsiella pneumoniae]|uniref:hypothetical protein n=1 Tax=Klebsiella pneumoniae TaxID=573 RepID=UPI0040556A25
MIDGVKLNVSYKDLMELIVCDINNHDCMMNVCTKCPGTQTLLDIFNESEEEDCLSENIEFG